MPVAAARLVSYRTNQIGAPWRGAYISDDAVVRVGTLQRAACLALEHGGTMESDGALPDNEPALARKIILVVEDEFLVRMLLCDELRGAGYQIVEAANADEAVAILKSGSPVDLILSDVRMPGSMDGLGLLAVVRQSWPAIPVIITSGHLQPEAAFADGATQFLPKPYFTSQAIELIESELAKAR